MIYYTCDNDDIPDHGKLKRAGEPVVILKGVTGTSGGILLPEPLHLRHFCSSECFWTWVDKFNPDKRKSQK